MTKKDYILIANALKPFYQADYITTDERNIIVEMITAISKALKKDNQKFDPIKFLDYLRKEDK